MATYQYLNTEDFLAHLQLPGGDPREPFAKWALEVASSRVNRHCKRIFLPTPTTEPRRFDAGVSSQLPIDDLLASPAPVVKVGGVTLLSTEYQLLPYQLTDLKPHYDTIRLLDASTGQDVSWNKSARAALRPPTGDVGVTGKWGWDTAVPQEVQQAVEMIAMRLLLANDLKYGPGGGNVAVGETEDALLLDKTVTDLLAPFVRC